MDVQQLVEWFGGLGLLIFLGYMAFKEGWKYFKELQVKHSTDIKEIIAVQEKKLDERNRVYLEEIKDLFTQLRTEKKDSETRYYEIAKQNIEASVKLSMIIDERISKKT